MSVPRLVIAGTHSGVGKTTLAVGLMAALRRRGIRVAPFKVGPDYLDPGWHEAACGQPSAPLDTWMLGVDGVRESFARGTAEMDLALIEGMMGLFDGAEAAGDRGSTAEVARLLQAPVVLVLDGSALARSAGAVALGYRTFDPEVRLAGVIANRVSGEGHAGFLRPGIEAAGVPFLGWLPPAPEVAVPERHLGLLTTSAADPGVPSQLAELIEGQLDLDRFLALAGSAPDLPEIATRPLRPSPTRVRIGLARDEAFCFYYPDNLVLLQAAGAELVPFSPIRDPALPERLDGLYLGGGYPEVHAGALARNASMRGEVRRFAAAGKPVYAECGGFMYLCEVLFDATGAGYLMVGSIPSRCRMEPRLQVIGYREVTLRRDSLLGAKGTRLRGHEFHYSRLQKELPASAHAFDAGERSLGFATDNVLASYVHLHFGSCPGAAESLVQRCLAAR